MVTFEQLQHLVAIDETNRIEFKAEFSEAVLRGLSTDMASIANSQGGTIAFGVRNKELVGCKWSNKDVERISQEASNCRPPISISLEEIRSNERHFLLVHIPKSKIVHNDAQHRFPFRVGTITDYLETSGIVSLLQERSVLTAQQANTFGTQLASDRKLVPLSQREASLLVKGLLSDNTTVRIETLRDMIGMPSRFIVLENQKIADAFERILKSGREEEIKSVLDFLRGSTLWGTDLEKKTVTKWLNKLIDIGKSTSSSDTARKVFDVLQSAKSTLAIELLVHWVTRADETTYSQIAPQNMLANISWFGLKSDVREAMYGILDSDKGDRTQKRVLGVLENARQSY